MIYYNTAGHWHIAIGVMRNYRIINKLSAKQYLNDLLINIHIKNNQNRKLYVFTYT